MQKVECNKCGNQDAEMLRRGRYGGDVIFCPHCDDICN